MKNLISIFVVAAALCVTVQVSADTQRGIRNYQEVLSGRKKIEQLSQDAYSDEDDRCFRLKVTADSGRR